MSFTSCAGLFLLTSWGCILWIAYAFLPAARIAEEIGVQAAMAAQQAGAEAIVSACPFCEFNLSAAVKRLDSPLPVYDIIDLVDEALGKESKQQ